MYNYFSHGFDTVSVIKHLKAKMLSDGGRWDNIMSNRGQSNLCQFRRP